MIKLTEQDFVFNGRKNWKTFFKKQYLKENIQKEELKKEYSAEQIASKHNIPIENITVELKKGIAHEMEHTDDPLEARKIASQHLWETPEYYKKLDSVGLEEQKKKTIIRPDPSRSAPAQGSSQLATQSAGPGTTSPAVVAEEKVKQEVLPSWANTSLSKKHVPHDEMKKKLETITKIDRLLSTCEKNGLDGIGLDGYDFLMNNMDKMKPEQKIKFNNMVSMLEESKKEKLKQVKGVGAGLDRSGNKHMPPSKKIIPDKRNKLKDKISKFDEAENLSKFFKNQYKKLK